MHVFFTTTELLSVQRVKAKNKLVSNIDGFFLPCCYVELLFFLLIVCSWSFLPKLFSFTLKCAWISLTDIFFLTSVWNWKNHDKCIVKSFFDEYIGLSGASIMCTYWTSNFTMFFVAPAWHADAVIKYKIVYCCES